MRDNSRYDVDGGLNVEIPDYRQAHRIDHWQHDSESSGRLEESVYNHDNSVEHNKVSALTVTRLPRHTTLFYAAKKCTKYHGKPPCYFHPLISECTPISGLSNRLSFYFVFALQGVDITETRTFSLTRSVGCISTLCQLTDV